MTKTQNALENGLINGPKGTFLKMPFCNRNLLKRIKHTTALTLKGAQNFWGLRIWYFQLSSTLTPSAGGGGKGSPSSPGKKVNSVSTLTTDVKPASSLVYKFETESAL